MCECCNGDCKLCGGYGLNEFSIDKTFSEQISDLSEKCSKDLDTYLKDGFSYCRPSSSPDESFRAMIMIMQKWKEYMDLQKIDLSIGCSPPGSKFPVGDKLPNFISIPEYTPPKPTLLEDKMISQIKDMGRIQEKLNVLRSDEIFDNLSKHNQYFDSQYELEADKLDDLRRKLACIRESLDEILNILEKDEES